MDLEEVGGLKNRQKVPGTSKSLNQAAKEKGQPRVEEV